MIEGGTHVDIEVAILDLRTELLRAMERFPTWNSAHECYGKIAEEFRELEDHVFCKEANRDLPKMRKEAIQLACTALRFAIELCTEERGRR
mgnify:CR=1 FL=1